MDYINDFCRRYDEAWACGYSEFFENAGLCDRFYRGERIDKCLSDMEFKSEYLCHFDTPGDMRQIYG